MAEHNNTLENLRTDSYSFGSWEQLADITSKYDYSQLNYETLREIYLGLEKTGMQYGALMSRAIVEILTAFEIGDLPTAVIYDTKSGKENVEATAFAQTFLREQHHHIQEAITTKNIYGDGYLVFNVDRNLESLPPHVVFPGWSPFSSNLESATVIQIKRIKSQKGAQTAELKITRNYTAKDIKYEAELLDTVPGILRPKSVSVPNPLGVCPVIHLPNLRPAGYQFGVSDFYACIPYFLLLHHTLMRGYESQQYSGRPIMAITGIEGSVAQWLYLSFGIDPAVESETSLNSKILELFKRNKIFAFSGNVTASFVEPKMPIGKTEEVIKMLLGQVSRLSSVPEFVFGAALEQSNTSIREQYVSLYCKTTLKQTTLTPYLRYLIRMAMVWYSTITTNPETGEALETYGIVNTFEDAIKNFKIALIWPEFLASENRVKLEVLSMLSQANAVSRKGLQSNYPTYVPSPDAELQQILNEQELFQPPELPQDGTAPAANKPQSTKNADERRRKDKSTINNNADASKLDTPTRSKAKR